MGDVQIEGLRAVVKGFHTAADAKGAAAKVIAEFAPQVEANQRDRVPRDTGELADSIGITYSDGGMTADIGPTDPVAVPQEFGTVHHGPNSFVRGSADEVIPLIMAGLRAVADRT